MKKSILDVVHESAQDLHDIGAISEVTMREFDALCLPQVKNYTSTDIVRLRRSVRVSQPVFAAYLNTDVSTVRKWEQGTRTPSSFANKLLDLIERKGVDALN